MISVEVKQGPLDGQMMAVEGDTELFWLVPWEVTTLDDRAQRYRLVPNHKDLGYNAINEAVGLYERHVSIVDRHRRDYLIYRELPHGNRD